jgi:hypothetical protein
MSGAIFEWILLPTSPFVLTMLMLKIKGDPRGYAPWSQGENSEREKGRQGAERPLEGVFPSKNTPQSADLLCSLRAPRSVSPIKRSAPFFPRRG